MKGVCSAVSYLHEAGQSTSVLMMWSQPYDLNLYRSYIGVGLTSDSRNISSGLFSSMYYEQGPWERRPAGQLASFSDGNLEIVANMTQNTYKPVVMITISEVSEHKGRVVSFVDLIYVCKGDK